MFGKIFAGVVAVAAVAGTAYCVGKKSTAKPVAAPAPAPKASVVTKPATPAAVAPVVTPEPVKAEVVIGELQKTFEEVYAATADVIEFNASWANGTGYLNGATHVDLGDKAIAKSTDDTGRRILLLKIDGRVAVIFERYTPGHGAFVLVSNAPSELRGIVPNGSLDLDAFQNVVATCLR